MVLTDRQRHDLHTGIYEYLKSRDGDAFQQAAEAFAQADPTVLNVDKEDGNGNKSIMTTTLLEKKWTAIPRLQKKVLELERAAAHHLKIHAHRSGGIDVSSSSMNAGARRMLPRMPAVHTLQGHSAVVLAVEVHPVFTVVVSGSEDGTIKVILSV
jgi:platelet-activating factor acetylhydrolase IB subunit alpha